MLRLAHIVQPVIVPPTSDLFVAQPITFETMRGAQAFVQLHAAGAVEVSLFAIQYWDEERAKLPDTFIRVPDLNRSVADTASLRREWKLAVLADILNALDAAAGDADFLIYTNVDIALQPHFYLSVARFIERGYDAFVINRRCIPDHYSSVSQVPLMCEETGTPHKGYDCFVFRKEVFPRYRLGAVCLGTPWVDRALLASLVTYSKNFKEFRDEHLTFHIGNTRQWLREDFAEHVAYNNREYRAAFRYLEEEHGGFDTAWRSYLLVQGSERQYPVFPDL